MKYLPYITSKKKLSPTILIHSLDHPVPFEDIKRFTMKTLRMEEMNWVDIKKAINDGFKTVIIGVGSTEQHGPHLPTQTDALIADV